MSVANLRARLSDVSGIETLTMSLAGGKILLAWGNNYSATVGAAASDVEIETAIRNAIKLPAVSILDPVAPAPIAVASPAAVAAPAASPAPAATSQGGTMATPATAHLTVKDMMAAHMATMNAIHEAQMALLQSSLDRQATAVTGAVTSVVSKIDGQTDDFLSMMGQFSNDLG